MSHSHSLSGSVVLVVLAIYAALGLTAMAFGEELPIQDVHSADTNANGQIELAELLRVVQFFNTRGYHTCSDTEDGFCPGPAVTPEGEIEGADEEGEVEGSVEPEGEAEGSTEDCQDPYNIFASISQQNVVAGQEVEVTVSLNRPTCIVSGMDLSIALPRGSRIDDYTLTQGFDNLAVNVVNSTLLLSASSFEAVQLSGAFLSFSLRVSADAPAGIFYLNFGEDTHFYAIDGSEVGVNVVGGWVNILR